jgi:hypothetical protein
LVRRITASVLAILWFWSTLPVLAYQLMISPQFIGLRPLYQKAFQGCGDGNVFLEGKSAKFSEPGTFRST